jgi:hypothetical protein
MSNLSLALQLLCLNDASCHNTVAKLMIKGAENVSKNKSVIAIARLVMALPMLKILGHVIVNSELNDHDKKVF